MPTGTLYLVPTPLNTVTAVAALEKVIPQDVLKHIAQLGYFIVEHPKTARLFLKEVHQVFSPTTPLQAIQLSTLNVNTPVQNLPALLAPLLAGHDVGLMSEAGLPAIADPGAQLVELAHQHNLPVRPMVGPCSLLLALSASGLNGQHFAFNGYLPTDPIQRHQRIQSLEAHSRRAQQTQLFIETPYRNDALLSALCQSCRPDTQLCLAKNLTLPNEAIHTQSIAQWRTTLAQNTDLNLHKQPCIFLFLAQ